jgi:methyl-accepting chemotaxis protein
MLHKFKLSTRIMLIGIIIIFCFSLIFAWLLPKVKKNLYDAKYTKTQHVVEAVWGVLDYYSKQAKSNAMPLEEAKKKAIETIRNLHYDAATKDYFWLNDMEPRMIMHPNQTDLDGKSLTDYKDPNGKRLFVAMVDICKSSGAGFVEYIWDKPGTNKKVPKISYVKLFPDWDWIVGSGIYLDDVENEIAHILYVILGVVGVIVIGGLGLSFFMARSISQPINRVIEGLSDGADQVASGSSQVSSASQSLADGASEQAAGIEETSSSVEEMSSMTRQNANNANQANTLMAETSKVVDDANHSMAELTESMKEITAASEETAKIIKTIDEIAFQTNLLALNAAVEAARAGEVGAGFAVVADEVRNLAMRAADAAKNTANLIEGTVKKIKTGSDIVTKTNEAFGKVATGSKKVSELVGEITAASNEQAQGIEQISKSVAEMDKVVQKNAANAEESASASEEMNAQAEQMKDFVGELVTLVGGRNGNGAVSQKKGTPSIRGGNSLVSDVLHRPKNEPQKGHLPLMKRSQGKKAPISKLKEVRPDQVIPMEEADLKEF